MSELYLFDNNGVLSAFTPTIFSKTLNSIIYVPTLVVRSAINLTDNFAKSPVSFKFERTHSFAKQVLNDLPELPITVVIYRDGLVYWKGRVSEAKANILSIEISCESVFHTTARSGLQPRFTLNCRHNLYSQGCGVIQEVWASPYAVSNVASATFTVSGVTQESGFFSGGVAKLNGQSRYITNHSGSSFTVGYPFVGVQSGTIILYPGCRLTESACIGFDNLVNFGGFSRIPKKNPFGASGAL